MRAPLEPVEWLALLGQGPTGFEHPGQLASVPAEAPPALARANPLELAGLVERWVRRVALGGDRERSVARLDFAEGPLAGGSLTVVAGPHGVSVELELPRSAPDTALSERLRGRLERRGIAAEVTVR